MGRLADGAFTDRALRRAWEDVGANAHADGAEPPAGIARFAEHLDDEIGALVAEVAWGGYEPRDLTQVVMDFGRVLHIPAVRDRVVERAVLDVVQLYVDPVLGCSSYAYRPGLGVADAVQAVVALREEGFGWVLRTDVDQCFPSIPVPLARRMVEALVGDDELLRVVDLLLARPYRADGTGRHRMRGLARGCALSPMLANLVLTDLDDRLLRAGFRVVRYADDLTIAARDEDEAWEAARVAHLAVEQLGMTLGAEDTQVFSFEEGFTFPGEDFGPRYPAPLPGLGVAEPERKVLYLGLQGSHIRIAEGRLIVESAGDKDLLDVPSGQVRRIVCFGAVGVSAGVRSWAMSTGVDVTFASRRGRCLGALLPSALGPRADRLRDQVTARGSAPGLALCRDIVEATVRKQIVVLQRFGRRDHIDVVEGAVSGMRNVLAMLPACTSVDEVLGIEGAAASSYFPAYGALLPEELAFTHRTRRPPLDGHPSCTPCFSGNASPPSLQPASNLVWGSCTPTTNAAPVSPSTSWRNGGRWSSTRSSWRRHDRAGSPPIMGTPRTAAPGCTSPRRAVRRFLMGTSGACCTRPAARSPTSPGRCDVTSIAKRNDWGPRSATPNNPGQGCPGDDDPGRLRHHR